MKMTIYYKIINFGFVDVHIIRLIYNFFFFEKQSYTGEEKLYSVYVPTNHLYIGDIFLVNSKDVVRPNLSVREGIEIVVSGGMSMPQVLTTFDSGINEYGPRNNPS
ncbi:hypothetical protein HanLR1_Chr12g0430191 [Helianthus annuus]|nr:hypothetical protein HanLR1_Chr12g0430191 [Helianthus annuus]